MNKLERFTACTLFVIAALWAPIFSSAQSAFDGTWHINMSQAKISPKPIVFYLSQGWYHCVSCNPAYDAKADGTDQPVTGQSFDTIAITASDPKSITTTTKKGGKVVSEQTRTVSADGKTLTVKGTYHPMNSDQPETSEVIATRVGVAPAGVHATSGQWKIAKIQESDNGVTTTYKTNGDEFEHVDPNRRELYGETRRNGGPSQGSI